MYIAKHTLAIVALVIATTLWGAAGPILKWSLADASPFALSFFRFALATLIILPFVINNIKIRSKDFYKIFALSLFCISLHIAFYYQGLNLAPSINLPIIVSTTPIFLIIGGMFFLREKPTTNSLIGTLVSLIGAGIIIIQPLLGANEQSAFVGNIFFLLSTIVFVIYTILLKRFNLDYPFTTLLFWMFLLGSLTLFPFFLIELFTTDSTGIMEPRAIFGTLYGAIISSIICYFLYSYGAKHTKSDETGIFFYIEPFATALVAIPLLGETITFTYLLGAIFVFTGILISEAKLGRHHPLHLLKKRPVLPLESGP